MESHSIRYDWRRILNAGAGAAAAMISLALIGSADVVLVKHFFDPQSAGLYAAAALRRKDAALPRRFHSDRAVAAGRRSSRARRADARSSNGKPAAVRGGRALRALRLQIFRHHVLHALVGHAFDAAAPLLVTYGLAMVFLAFTNALTTYGIATHRLAFTVPLLICTLGTLGTIVVIHPTLATSSKSSLSEMRLPRSPSRASLLAAAKHDRSPVDRVTRVLLIGGSGQLGTAIRQRWSDCEIVAPAHGEVPFEESATVRDALDRIRPDVLVNAAAFHDVDRCENEPEQAFAINAVAVGRAASLALECGMRFVTISTDYVFDGKTNEPYGEDAAPHPLSTYGASKLAGEYLSDRIGSRAFVVRTCGLYGRSPSPARRR